MKTVPLILAAVLLSACASGNSAPPVALDRSFQGSGFGISDGSKVAVLMKAMRSDNGMVRVCGAWQLQSNSPAAGRMAEDFLFGAKLFLSDVEILKRLSFFHEIEPGKPLAGQTAKCRDTKTPWQTGFATATLQAVYPRRAFSR